MAISDFISTSFLFSISIVVILIGGIFAYVSYRMSEQDHKLTSMLGLVSTLAEEVRSLKVRNVSVNLDESHNDEEYEQEEQEEEEDNNKKINEIHIFDQNILSGGSNNLISVSDNESNADDLQDSESESDSDSESESESDSDSKVSYSDDESDSDINNNDIKILNLGESLNDFNIELNTELNDELNDELNKNLEEFNELGNDNDNDNDIKSIHLAEPIDLKEPVSVLDTSELKTIMISEPDLKPDYKKMGLNKLREVVAEKNILPLVEASKLKKPDLLKLLDDQ